MANPPFQVEGPPYPSDLPFYQTEALSWLLNNRNPVAFAGSRFHSTQEAIESVKRLYAAGASRVDVVVTHNELWRIEEEGGHYADELEVSFPKGSVREVVALMKSMNPTNWSMDPDQAEQRDPGFVSSRYAEYTREVEGSSKPSQTVTLSWH